MKLIQWMAVSVVLFLMTGNLCAAENKDAKKTKPKFDSSAIWGVRRGPNYKPPKEALKGPAADTSEADAMNRYYEDGIRNGTIGGAPAGTGQSAQTLSPEQCELKNK